MTKNPIVTRVCGVFCMGKKLIQARIAEDSAAAIVEEASKAGVQVKDILESMGHGIMGGVLKYEDGLKPTEEDQSGEYDHLGFKRVLGELRDKGYTDQAIREMNERMVEQIRDAPRYKRG